MQVRLSVARTTYGPSADCGPVESHPDGMTCHTARHALGDSEVFEQMRDFDKTTHPR
jgi:hypothetical protein